MQLNEISNSYVELIQQHCQEYLHVVGESVALSKFLYKGVWDPPKTHIGWLSSERPDLNVPEQVHKEFDRVFQKYLNFPYSKATFVSTDDEQAGEYGDDVFAVFPIGSFKFCYSPTVYDMMYMTDEPDEMSDNEIEVEEIEPAILANRFTTKNLKQCFSRPGEVMLVGSKAIYVPVDLLD